MKPTESDKTREAFLLYNEGKYQESLDLCNRLLVTAKDPALEVLAATNLFCLKRTADAEVYFRDLARKMPGSSHVHSFLAKILEENGDDGAVAEYAVAVRLDPENPDALRSYAAILVARNDDRGALPVLRRLCAQKKRPDDIDRLAGTLVRAGYPQEACHLYEDPDTCAVRSREYAEALHAARRFPEAADAARVLYEERRDPALLRVYLAARAETDPAGALTAYAATLKDNFDVEIAGDYTRLLVKRGEFFPALATVKKLIARDNRPHHRLMECEIYAALGDTANADVTYDALVREGQETPYSSETLTEILRSFEGYLFAHLPRTAAKERFLSCVSGEGNIACLTGIARMYCTLGERDSARAWFYRAYRSDFLNGGLPYAAYLAETGEDREAEKVFLHILSNVRRSADLARVSASLVADGSNLLLRMKRLNTELIRRLEECRTVLGTAEKECLAGAYLAQAEDALVREDFPAGIQSCLRGIDALPPYSGRFRPESFLSLIRRSKEQMPADISAFPGDGPKTQEIPRRRPVAEIADRLALPDQERTILAFLATHGRASEAELRRLTGSRRVAGMVNSLIRKGAAQGIMIVEKKGMGAEGEMYEYCGT